MLVSHVTRARVAGGVKDADVSTVDCSSTDRTHARAAVTVGDDSNVDSLESGGQGIGAACRNANKEQSLIILAM